MSAEERIVRMAEIRFCDGTRYFAATDSVAEFLLHPVFLKYMLVCVLVYALLDRGAMDTGHLAGFQIVVLWSVIALASLAWYGFALSVLKFLWLRGWIRLLYTPLLILPLFAVTSATTYAMVMLMTGTVMTDPSHWVTEIARDIIVLLLMDLVFGNYVAPFHPALRSDPPKASRDRNAPEPAAAEPVDAPFSNDEVIGSGPTTLTPLEQGGDAHFGAGAQLAALTDVPSAQEAMEVLRVGNEVVPAQSIIFVRSEDHYIRVVTPDRRLMVRGRLSEALAQLDYRLGLQINRSAWVAFSAINDVAEDDRGRLTITLSSGDVERVAQSRRIAFLAALDLKGRIQ